MPNQTSTDKQCGKKRAWKFWKGSHPLILPYPPPSRDIHRLDLVAVKLPAEPKSEEVLGSGGHTPAARRWNV
jgi:hypothetical protein